MKNTNSGETEFVFFCEESFSKKKKLYNKTSEDFRKTSLVFILMETLRYPCFLPYAVGFYGNFSCLTESVQNERSFVGAEAIVSVIRNLRRSKRILTGIGGFWGSNLPIYAKLNAFYVALSNS